LNSHSKRRKFPKNPFFELRKNIVRKKKKKKKKKKKEKKKTP